MTVKQYPADDRYLGEVLSLVEEEVEKSGGTPKAAMQITVCVEEMFVNVAHYAYGGEQGDVEIRVDFSDGTLSVSLIDGGVPFDPLAKEDPDITLSAEERKIGGLGIFMVKKYMDDVCYERKDGKNIFTMKKKL